MDKMLLKEVLASTDFAMWPAFGLVLFTGFMLGVFAWVIRPGSAERYRTRGMSVFEAGEGKGHE